MVPADGAGAVAASTLAVAREGLTAADALIRSLWSLELLRVAREWMVTGGALPDTVAADVAAELTTALRMDLERHREETGIPGDLDASRALDGDVPTATALTAFRLTQEVIAVTARASDGFTVRASLDDGALAVAVALDAADADVPAVVHAIAAGAGATVTVDGPTVTLRFPL